MSRRKLTISLILWVLMTVLMFAAIDERMVVRRYEVEAEEIAAPVRLVVLTDYHGCDYGPGGADLVEAVAQEEPDAILLVGDMFSSDGDPDEELTLFGTLAQIAPTYYVTGNHEFWEYDVPSLMTRVADTGVTVLNEAGVTVELNGQRINLCGIHDQAAISYLGLEKTIRRVRAAIAGADPDAYTILLSHRPELWEVYGWDKQVDLVFAGHAHGGQVRIPFLINGLYAPNQGWFPDYAGGQYELDGMTMIVSRGLSKQDQKYIPRIFNRPELVIVTLE